jgi:2-succinyl-5-enolpyruvyl-6-hydroxy-3-cyclohexene-1-carboxylate synthase
MASRLAPRLPEGSTIHFGILNSLRAWNFFELPASVTSSSNVGGFGIDGCLSSLVGASLAHKEKLYFAVLGDLAFFYDMNVLGNRHLGNNVRILLVNNGKGTEFKNYTINSYLFGDSADPFMAAAGHFGNKSPNLVKHYAEDLGFEYFSASSKEEFDGVYERFLSPELSDRPMLCEVFTDSELENTALRSIRNIDESTKHRVKEKVKELLGDDGLKIVQRLTRALKGW